ncbi:MAG: hypothetical protein KDB50_05380 [Mycobacterium sp.]|nr:hypothetical protein [Mycobacterium sp.]
MDQRQDARSAPPGIRRRGFVEQLRRRAKLPVDIQEAEGVGVTLNASDEALQITPVLVHAPRHDTLAGGAGDRDVLVEDAAVVTRESDVREPVTRVVISHLGEHMDHPDSFDRHLGVPPKRLIAVAVSG